MKKKFIDFYMKFAQDTAQLSSARRLKVGSVLVREDKILSFGYNGTHEGHDNNCEIEVVDEVGTLVLTTKQEVIHSEMNTIGKLTRSNESSENATMIMTHSPCIECAKMISRLGLRELIYKDEYRSLDGVNFLRSCGLTVTKYEK